MMTYVPDRCTQVSRRWYVKSFHLFVLSIREMIFVSLRVSDPA